MGVIQTEDPVPDLVYGNDGEELMAKLDELGLVAYVGVMPHLRKIPKEADLLPGSWPCIVCTWTSSFEALKCRRGWVPAVKGCAQQAAFVGQLRASVLSLKSCQEAPDYSIQEMAPYA
jgi:hypothetical protein